MSPHILIDNELETLAHPSAPIIYSEIIQKNLNKFLRDEEITVEEFHHYCKRLNAVVAGRKEVA